MKTRLKNKKSIIISEETHILIKNYCDKNSLKLNDWIDKELLRYMGKLNEKVQKKVSDL